MSECNKILSLRGEYCSHGEQYSTKQSPSGLPALLLEIASLDSSGPCFTPFGRFAILAMTFWGMVLSSCEQVVPSDGLPYAEHIVVRGILIAGQPLDSISITRTLPLTVAYDREAASLPSADVLVTVDNRSIKLTSIGNGYFSDTTSTIVESGKQYSLAVSWNGLHATASTTVPDSAIVDSSKLGARRVYYYNYGGAYGLDSSVSYPLLVRVHAQPNVAFAMSRDSMIIYRGTSQDIDYNTGVMYFSEPQIATVGSSTLWLEDSYGGRIQDVDSIKMLATIASYDKAYYDFRRTSSDYRDESPFGNTGKNPKWNIREDGIGYFIGEAMTRVFVSFKP